MPKRIAEWNPARSVWETGQGQLCGHSDVFSETWPSSGMTRNGVAYALPTWGPPMDDSASLSLLGTPRTSSSNGVGQYMESERGTRGRLEAQMDLLLRTPTAQLAVNGGSQHPDKRKAGGHGPTLADEVEHLLPTPEASDGTGGRKSAEVGGVRPSGSKRAITLATRVDTLLPTPRATDGTKGGPNQRGSSGDLMLPSAVHHLLPTPTSMDSHSSGGSTTSHVTLTDATVRTQLGARTNPRFDGGKPSSDDQHPHLLSPDPEVDNDSPRGSLNG